jgi:hypothetical protein
MLLGEKPSLSITERVFQANVLTLARLYRWAPYHTYRSDRSEAGFPDLVMVRPPRVVFAELKTEKGKASDAQRGWLELLAVCPGIETYLWRPSHWEEIVMALA